jgi:hypothetical protein
LRQIKPETFSTTCACSLLGFSFDMLFASSQTDQLDADSDKPRSMSVDVRLYLSLLVESGVIAVVFNGGGRRGDPWRINGGEAHYGSC